MSEKHKIREEISEDIELEELKKKALENAKIIINRLI